MDNIIKVEKKRVYGNDLIYIKNEPYRECLEQLTKKITIDKNDIASLEALGFKVEAIAPEL